jgi:hypothetical protein
MICQLVVWRHLLYVKTDPIEPEERRTGNRGGKASRGINRQEPLLPGQDWQAGRGTGRPSSPVTGAKWSSSVNLPGAHERRLGPICGLARARGGRRRPKRPDAPRDPCRHSNNGVWQARPFICGGESRLHWQLGACGALPKRVASPPQRPLDGLPRVVARFGAFSRPRLVANRTRPSPTYKRPRRPRSLSTPTPSRNLLPASCLVPLHRILILIPPSPSPSPFQLLHLRKQSSCRAVLC